MPGIGVATRRAWLLTGTVLLVGSALLAGCASYGSGFRPVAEALRRQQPELALQALEEQAGLGGDRVLYELDRGMLLRMLGRHEDSNLALERAKGEMQRRYGISVSEQVGATLINDTLIGHAGPRHEQLLVHAYKALNYLAQGEADSARVEVLQAEVRMNTWGRPPGDSSDFRLANFVGGLVFEHTGEPDQALVAYRRLARERPAAGYLQAAMARLAPADEAVAAAAASAAPPADSGDLVVLVHLGLVPARREHLTLIWHSQLMRSVQIALPYYPPRLAPLPEVWVEVDAQRRSLEPLADPEALARDALAEAMPAITARALGRMLLKHQSARHAGQQSELAGLAVTIAGLVTERADTRSWGSLPARIQVLRLPLAAGEHRLGLGLSGSARGAQEQRVQIRPNRVTLVEHHLIPRTP